MSWLNSERSEGPVNVGSLPARLPRMANRSVQSGHCTTASHERCNLATDHPQMSCPSVEYRDEIKPAVPLTPYLHERESATPSRTRSFLQ